MPYIKKLTAFIALILLLSNVYVFAQVVDSTSLVDVIVRVDGTLTYGKVTEIDQEFVKYRDSTVPNGPIISLPRKLVYTISYSNNTSVIITPKFGTRKIRESAFDENALETEDEEKIDWKYNIQHGSLKVGLGLSRSFSSFKGVKGFTKTASAPALFVSYTFRFNRFLLLGGGLGYASFNYDYKLRSDYDDIDIKQTINESVTTLNLFGRYDLMTGFLRPHIILGINVNYAYVDLNGEIFFRDNLKRVATSSGLRGFKTNFVLRGGLDFNISKTFGVFGDIGTGTSLVNLGAIFILK